MVGRIILGSLWISTAERSFDRIQSNAGNIGFAASVPTGMNDISVNVRCEQFTYFNHFAGGTGWCNRNSKIGLSHPQMGEIMFATWLLPYNEGVAQWVDPFYDAGADSHTSIMGSVGATTIFYNTGDFDHAGRVTVIDFFEFNYADANYDMGFNRRQENIIQYWSPNWNGFVFRFAWTAGNRDESEGPMGNEIDPVIRSSSLAYTNGPLWLAVTWQDHEDWTVGFRGRDGDLGRGELPRCRSLHHGPGRRHERPDLGHVGRPGVRVQQRDQRRCGHGSVRVREFC